MLAPISTRDRVVDPGTGRRHQGAPADAAGPTSATASDDGAESSGEAYRPESPAKESKMTGWPKWTFPHRNVTARYRTPRSRLPGLCTGSADRRWNRPEAKSAAPQNRDETLPH